MLVLALVLALRLHPLPWRCERALRNVITFGSQSVEYNDSIVYVGVEHPIVAFRDSDPIDPMHAQSTPARDRSVGHLGCARCLQPLGEWTPERYPECGAALDLSNPQSVCDLRTTRPHTATIVGFAAGGAVGALLGFGWWFGLMQHNTWLPILNVIAPLVCLAAMPAILCARLARVGPTVAYAVGSLSFIFWATLAIAIDQLLQGVPLTGLSIDYRNTLLVAAPMIAVVIAIGLGFGGFIRVVFRRAQSKA